MTCAATASRPPKLQLHDVIAISMLLLLFIIKAHFSSAPLHLDYTYSMHISSNSTNKQTTVILQMYYSWFSSCQRHHKLRQLAKTSTTSTVDHSVLWLPASLLHTANANATDARCRVQRTSAIHASHWLSFRSSNQLTFLVITQIKKTKRSVADSQRWQYQQILLAY